jgi:hypothetical protein
VSDEGPDSARSPEGDEGPDTAQPVEGDRPPPEEAPRADDDEGPDSARSTEQAEPDWRRRRRLAEVFGDVLPDTTGDERSRGDSGTSEEWLRRQVPPHHG